MSGGGGSSSAPTNQTVTSTSIPEYARPYAESMLGQTSALTNINNNPYQPYQGQQIAGFSPMQVQGMSGIANQQVAPQLTDASNFAFQSGAGGLGAYQNSAALQNASLNYGSQGANSAAVNAALANTYAGAGAQGAFANADLINAYGGEAFKSGQLGQQLGVEGGAKFGNMGSAYGAQGADIGTAGGAYYGGQGMNYGAQGANLAGANLGVGMTGMQAGLGYGQGAQNPYAVQGYMNPYLQASLQPQLAEMQRQYGISGAQGQSNATKAGAFGGSREALIFAENQRNKNIAMNQAIGQGYNTAYDVANRNMQAAASLGMQGAGVGLAGLQGANQNYLTGLQGAQTGLQGVNTQLAGTAQGMQGAQVGLAGVDRQLAGTAQGMQGASLGMQGANQAGQLMIGGGQLGMQGAQTAGNMGIAGANIGMQGVQGAVGAGQYGLAGLGLAGSAASTLGALGQTQFGQQQAINQAQMQAGAQQQALQQQGLNVAYQQYQDQMNYPYKQLAFQSDMMRGLPMSQASQTMYQNTGAMAPQILGAGLAAYGATNKSAKEGGLMSYARGGAVQGYAMGGQPVVDPRAVAATSPAALSSKLSQLTDGQLQAYARTVKDAVALAEVKAEMTRRASVRQPQGEMPTQTVAQEVAGQGGIAEQPVMAAGGGIVALAGGSKDATEDDTFGSDVRLEDVKEKKPSLEGMFGLRGAKVPRSQVIPAPANDKTMANWDASGREIARDTELFAERQGVAQDQQARQIPELANWDASGREIARDTELFAERQAMAQDQQNRADTAAQMYAGNAQEGPGQYPNLGGITAIPPVAGATPATGAPVGGGIIPTSAVPPAGGGITDVGTPAGGAPRTGTTAPVNAITPRTPGAGGFGAVPTVPGVAGAGDIFGWGTYAANVAKAAEFDPEDKAVLADLQKRTERKLQRAEKQERGVMSEAMIAGGIAMMGGMNLSDGIRRLAEAGGKQYFSSQAEARKAIEKADEAQDAFSQYKLSLKQGNKKLAAEMYGKYFNTVMDFQGKIQAAGITAGASREATAEAAKTRLQIAEDNRTQRAQEFEINQARLRNDMTIRVAELESRRDDARAQNALTAYRGFNESATRVEAQKTAAINAALKPFTSQYEMLSMQATGPKADPKAKEAFRVLQAQIAVERDRASKPFDLRILELDANAAKALGMSTLSGKGGIPTYDPATQTWK